MEWKLSQKEVTVKAMTTSLKQLENKINLLEDRNRLVQNNKVKLMRKYSAQKTVAEKSVENVMNSIAWRSIGMEMCISKATTSTTWNKYSSYTISVRTCVRIGPNIPGEVLGVVLTLVAERVQFQLVPFFMMSVNIYKRSFTSEITTLVQLAEAHSQSVE